MDTRAQLGMMPRALILLLTIALLAAILAASLAIAGNLTHADDGGDVTAGLTYSTSEGVIYTHPTDGAGDPIPLTPDDEYAILPFWSPAGTRFSYESWTDLQDPIMIKIRDADGSNPVVVSEPLKPAPRGVKPNYHAWSPDGSSVIYAAERFDDVDDGPACGLPVCGQRIWIAASDGSMPARVIGDPALDARAPVWTPDGEGIIFAGSADGEDGYGLYRMDADGANVERIGDLTGFGQSFDQLSISPDGTMLAVDGTTVAVSSGSEYHEIYLVDLATGEDMLIAAVEWMSQSEPYWSPDGSLIAFTRFDALEQAVLYDVASGEVISLDTSLVVVHGWSPDGRSILGDGPDGILTVVDVTDPMVPVATKVEGVTEVDLPSWQPRP